MRFRKLESVIDAVGNTPLVRLRSIEKETPGVEIYLKLEYMNPGGSVKDRPARQILLAAVEESERGQRQCLPGNVLDVLPSVRGQARHQVLQELVLANRQVSPDQRWIEGCADPLKACFVAQGKCHDDLTPVGGEDVRIPDALQSLAG